MEARIVIMMLFCCNAVALWGYSCPSCSNAMLNSDNFCQNCGRSRDEKPIKKQAPPQIRQPASPPVYRPVVRQPQPSDHSTGANAYSDASLYRRAHWTPIKIGFGGSASLPSISNASVGGLDLEFGAMGDTLYGIGLGGFGQFREIYGVQCSAIGSFNSSDNVVCGLQLSGFIGNQSGRVYGIQVGGVLNNAMKEMYGIQIAAVGNSAGKMHGLQIGLYNGDRGVDMCGIQIGVVNTAKRMTGIQIGALNFIDHSPLAFFPIVNMHF